jgi:uncharacterized protein YecT (DUF1311 family)
MKFVLLALALTVLTANTALAESEYGLDIISAMNVCENHEAAFSCNTRAFKLADARLNQEYKAAGDRLFKQDLIGQIDQLKREQIQWIAHRNDICRANPDTKKDRDGRALREGHYRCFVTVTLERAEQLSNAGKPSDLPALSASCGPENQRRLDAMIENRSAPRALRDRAYLILKACSAAELENAVEEFQGVRSSQ